MRDGGFSFCFVSLSYFHQLSALEVGVFCNLYGCWHLHVGISAHATEKETRMNAACLVRRLQPSLGSITWAFMPTRRENRRGTGRMLHQKCGIGRWRATIVGLLLGGIAFAFGGVDNASGASEVAAVAENETASEAPILLPRPRKLLMLPESHQLAPERFILLEGASSFSNLRTARMVQKELESLGQNWEVTASRGTDALRIGCVLEVNPDLVNLPQGYRLNIDKNRIRIVGYDEAGLFYGAMTLKQVVAQSAGSGQIPCLRIEDHPDFPNRGILLDVSRDKVPTLESLFDLVDLISEWKMNELQLYTEHTFAYRNHREVWEKASPLTGEDILALDAYCRERFVRLVPNQNSFAHMGRWLGHDSYRHLAEVPESPGTLCPTNPGSIELLRDLYNDLLPHFSSSAVNVGCDETWDLGHGGSKQAVEERGVGRVYLEFLTQINEIVRSHGKTMQFWGDIILNHPELIPELPDGVIAMNWGYSAANPYDKDCKKFADAGVPSYVCPGTSTWNTLIGRTENAVGNLLNAAENGLKYGAIGYLVTDWGDGGHWQQRPISYLGYAYGAALSWCVDRNRDVDLPLLLDRFAFRDSAGIMGRVAFDLGNTYLEVGVLVGNASVFSRLLSNPNLSLKEKPFDGLTVEGFGRAKEKLADLEGQLENASMQIPDAALVLEEFRNGIALSRHACNLGIARLQADGAEISGLPIEKRRELAGELEPIISEYKRIWLLRNRPGGLEDSAGRFDRLLDQYKS